MVNVSLRKRQRTNDSSKEDDSEQEYQVEAVLDKRVRGKTTEYLLKWQGYSHAENTWEKVSHLNCPGLIREFEEQSKRKKADSVSPTKNRTSSTKAKNTNMNETDEDYRSDAGQSMVTDIDIVSTDNDDDSRVTTRQSPRKKHTSPKPTQGLLPSTRRHSNRKAVNQTKSRITTMCKTDTSDDDDPENTTGEDRSSSIKKSDKSLPSTPKRKKASNDTSLIVYDDEHRNQNNNNSVDVADKSPAKEISINEPTTINLRLHITPSSTSSISLTLNDSDNNNNNKQRPSTDMHLSEHDVDETIDETDQVQKIEAVRRNQEGIAFRIKLADEDESRWIPAKVANRKYPQAIIAFWEGHVEFT